MVSWIIFIILSMQTFPLTLCLFQVCPQQLQEIEAVKNRNYVRGVGVPLCYDVVTYLVGGSVTEFMQVVPKSIVPPPFVSNLIFRIIFFN